MAYDFSSRKHPGTDVVQTTGVVKLNNFVDDVETAANELLNMIETHAEALTICTSTTRPVAPALGELIVETDTGKMYQCTNAVGPVWSETFGQLAKGISQILLTEQGVAPSTGASQGALYTKDIDGHTELFFREENDGDEVQLTSLGGSTMPESFATGAIQQGIFTSLPGWVLLDGGTIGSSASTATNRANDDTEALFKLLWNNISDTWAPVAGGRGGDADSDWTNNKVITLLPALGRALISAGAGAGMTARILGETGGGEMHQLTVGEMPNHGHSIWNLCYGQNVSGNVSCRLVNSTTSGGSVGYTGGDEAHNNMQPFLAVNTFIKL